MISAIPNHTARGVRNSNPLNIRHSPVAWAGKAAVQSDPDFVQFIDAHHGLRAGARNLLTYYRKYKLATVPAIVGRWAPPEDDNDTGAYVTSVCSGMGVTADTRLDLEDPDVLASLVTAMVKVECGLVPYPPETIRAAVEAAYGNGSGHAGQAPVSAIPEPPPDYRRHPYAERPVPPLVDQPGAAPTRKVQAIPLGGLVGVPVAWMAKALWDRLVPESPMPVEVAMFVAGLVATACAYLAAYFTRNRATAPPPPPPYHDEWGAYPPAYPRPPRPAGDYR